MHKLLHEKYRDVLWTHKQIPMFSDIVRSAINIKTPQGDNVLPEVLKVIADKTSLPDRLRHGITKSEIQSCIMIRSKTKEGAGFQSADTPLSRKVCDDCINILIGASLIYADKRIQCTQRGLLIAQHLMTEEDIPVGEKQMKGGTSADK